MFKNLKIGKKINLGFGIIIGYTLLIALSVFITNTMTIGAVEALQAETTLVQKANNVLNALNAARIPANVLYSSIDETASATFDTRAKETDTAFGEVYGFIDENPKTEEFRAGIQAAEQDFLSWRASVGQVIEGNDRRAVLIEQIGEGGQETMALAAGLLQNQIDQIGSDASSLVAMVNAGESLSSDDFVNSMLYRGNRVNEAYTAVAAVRTMHFNVTRMTDNLNVSDMEGVWADVNNAVKAIQSFLNDSANADNLTNARRVLDNLEAYKLLLEEFEAESIQAAEVQSAALAEGEDAHNTIQKTVDTLDEVMSKQVTDTRSMAQSSMIAVIVIIVLEVVGGFVLGDQIKRSITGPIQLQMNFLAQVGDTGNLTFTDEEWTTIDKAMKAKDETGAMLTAFVKMLRQFAYYGETLEKVAAKDMSVEVNKLSDKDTMGNSLDIMVASLNDMFGEINSISAQVATASNDIAQGAQALAQGSTEQASTVEELSTAISQIQQQASDNSEMAIQTVNEVNEAGRLMDESLEYMSQMTRAMDAIETSSNEIAKVISVIDNIAFQTNILALNAAVEAARAGQHGKGFAVVADEVRNLATKSQQAARETADLIDSSVRNVKSGAGIVEKTGESLRKVGEIAQSNAVAMGKLSESSEQQSAAITEINTGITQISQVVQRNSATSEESAAGSEEMSAQAQTLQRLIANFKLRNQEPVAHAVPELPQAQSRDMGGYGGEIIF